ncbi:MAG: ABC transporter ATP-binding protein [Acidimicrobiales bacterium]
MLVVDRIQVSYDPAHILDGTSLEVADGEVLGLLGRNGMGKTTLVRTIAGINPPQQTAGTITWQGEDITRLESYKIARRGIGYVPQGRHIFGSLTVVENLEVIARAPAHGTGQPWDAERVFSFFPRLEERQASLARTLSGGEQQMLAIGRALMTNPTLLLMDEPSEGLAPIILGIIRDTLAELKGPGLSILLVEQNLGLALSLADRLLLMSEYGKIVWEGTPEELKIDDTAMSTHLGV